MIRRLLLVLAGLSLLSTPGLGVEAIESVFQVSYTHAGREHFVDDRVVPLLPGNACYSWYLRLTEANAAVTAVERFRLPEPLAAWATTGSTPDDSTRIEEDGQVAVTTIEAVSDDEGWISHGWCAAVGDPLGLHRIDVVMDGTSLAEFEFDVVAPEDYGFPTTAPPDPNARSANNSW